MIAACSEVSFSPTRTARPSSARSKTNCWRRDSNSAALRTAMDDMRASLARDGERPDRAEQVVDREGLAEDGRGPGVPRRLDLDGARDQHDRDLERLQLVEH